MSKATLSIRPELLRWARESAGITQADACVHFKISEKDLATWETEGAKFTPRQLEEVADYYKRSTAIFFVRATPREPPTPVDFRTIRGASAALNSKTLFALRRARRAQRVFVELHGELSEEPIDIQLPTITLTDDTTRVAAQLRTLLRISQEAQRAWRKPGIALREWRRALEGLGLLTFQFAMGDEVSGLSLPGTVPAVLLNASDPATRRIFTLFHEAAHLCLGAPGLCRPDKVGHARQTYDTETFCDSVAANLLVPPAALRDAPGTLEYRSGVSTLMRALRLLSDEFAVSRDVALRRLHSLQLVSRTAYDNTRRELAKLNRGFGRGKADWSERPINQLGARFVKVVLEAHHRGIATPIDLSDYLGTSTNYIKTRRS